MWYDDVIEKIVRMEQFDDPNNDLTDSTVEQLANMMGHGRGLDDVVDELTPQQIFDLVNHPLLATDGYAFQRTLRQMSINVTTELPKSRITNTAQVALLLLLHARLRELVRQRTTER